MNKNLIKHLFNLFKAKKESAKLPTIAPRTSKDSALPLNKFGEPECLVNQCENKTCTCGPTECRIDDQIFYESALLSTYVQNMKNAKSKKK